MMAENDANVRAKSSCGCQRPPEEKSSLSCCPAAIEGDSILESRELHGNPAVMKVKCAGFPRDGNKSYGIPFISAGIKVNFTTWLQKRLKQFFCYKQRVKHHVRYIM